MEVPFPELLSFRYLSPVSYTHLLGEDIPKVELLNQFAIIRIPESRIEELSRNPQIEFVEKPKRLFFAVNQGKSASCMTAVQSEFSPLGEALTGEGVLVACIEMCIRDSCNTGHTGGGVFFRKSKNAGVSWKIVFGMTKTIKIY